MDPSHSQERDEEQDYDPTTINRQSVLGRLSERAQRASVEQQWNHWVEEEKPVEDLLTEHAPLLWILIGGQQRPPDAWQPNSGDILNFCHKNLGIETDSLDVPPTTHDSPLVLSFLDVVCKALDDLGGEQEHSQEPQKSSADGADRTTVSVPPLFSSTPRTSNSPRPTTSTSEDKQGNDGSLSQTRSTRASTSSTITPRTKDDNTKRSAEALQRENEQLVLELRELQKQCGFRLPEHAKQGKILAQRVERAKLEANALAIECEQLEKEIEKQRQQRGAFEREAARTRKRVDELQPQLLSLRADRTKLQDYVIPSLEKKMLEEQASHEAQMKRIQEQNKLAMGRLESQLRMQSNELRQTGSGISPTVIGGSAQSSVPSTSHPPPL